MSETFKVDKEIGKQKFKAKRQYIVELSLRVKHTIKNHLKNLYLVS